ncbi:serine/threonine protein kinase [Sulfolobus sp. S-194]|uniref:serine/threonine-protein kinase n=1 Tax=Sulfolobus sp. S-194 TaxID=2512240 RepID=UPI0014370449|nr:serine/threonine-protein kinase [Sulfolobus sp. S-194]QIW23089.1 serine/threonine protein kinase [Sulfolobus sp. S-194]
MESLLKTVFALLAVEGFLFDLRVFMHLPYVSVILLALSPSSIVLTIFLLRGINKDWYDEFTIFLGLVFLLVSLIVSPTIYALIAYGYIHFSSVFLFAITALVNYTIPLAMTFYDMLIVIPSRRLRLASCFIMTQFLSPLGAALAYTTLNKITTKKKDEELGIATFYARGLPCRAKAIINVGGKTYKFKDTINVKVHKDGEFWKTCEVKTREGIYEPRQNWGVAYPGDVFTIEYSLAKPKNMLPSTITTPSTIPPLTNWDPKIWQGRYVSNYFIEKYIGEGGNGYVLKAKYGDSKEVAIKILKLLGGKPMEFFKELSQEALNLVTVSDHPNIVKVYAFNLDSLAINKIINGDNALYLTDPPMIVMELMAGTLNDLLLDDRFYLSVNWKKAVYKAIKEVALALKYIHENGYVHMDIKPSNIFITKKPMSPQDLLNVGFKLGDLGSALRVSSKINQLTLEYSPPEVFEGIAKPLLDIFALGMTIYVLLNRKADRPDLVEMNEAFDCYVKHDLNCVSLKISEAKTKLSSWQPNLPDEIENFVKRMLSPDPSTRPTAEEVVMYFNSLP